MAAPPASEAAAAAGQADAVRMRDCSSVHLPMALMPRDVAEIIARCTPLSHQRVTLKFTHLVPYRIIDPSSTFNPNSTIAYPVKPHGLTSATSISYQSRVHPPTRVISNMFRQFVSSCPVGCVVCCTAQPFNVILKVCMSVLSALQNRLIGQQPCSSTTLGHRRAASAVSDANKL